MECVDNLIKTEYKKDKEISVASQWDEVETENDPPEEITFEEELLKNIKTEDIDSCHIKNEFENGEVDAPSSPLLRIECDGSSSHQHQNDPPEEITFKEEILKNIKTEDIDLCHVQNEFENGEGDAPSSPLLRIDCDGSLSHQSQIEEKVYPSILQESMLTNNNTIAIGHKKLQKLNILGLPVKPPIYAKEQQNSIKQLFGHLSEQKSNDNDNEDFEIATAGTKKGEEFSNSDKFENRFQCSVLVTDTKDMLSGDSNDNPRSINSKSKVDVQLRNNRLSKEKSAFISSEKKDIKKLVKLALKEKKFKCLICKSRFRKAKNLRRHTRNHNEEKAFKCEKCNYSSTNGSHLEIHIRTHTRERPYKCSKCNFSCSDPSSLRRHDRTHTGEKPYKCIICNFSSGYASALKTHYRIHTGEKPYKCVECSDTFSRPCQLKRHNRVHIEKSI